MLSPVLVVAFVVVVLARKPDAISASLPGDARGAMAHDFGSVSDIVRAREIPSSLGGTFVIGAPSEGRLLVRQKGEPSPDTLAYWTAGNGAIDALPPDAKLLGPVGSLPREYQRPPGDGQVVFYSLAHGAVVGHASPEGN